MSAGATVDAIGGVNALARTTSAIVGDRRQKEKTRFHVRFLSKIVSIISNKVEFELSTLLTETFS